MKFSVILCNMYSLVHTVLKQKISHTNMSFGDETDVFGKEKRKFNIRVCVLVFLSRPKIVAMIRI